VLQVLATNCPCPCFSLRVCPKRPPPHALHTHSRQRSPSTVILALVRMGCPCVWGRAGGGGGEWAVSHGPIFSVSFARYKTTPPPPRPPPSSPPPPPGGTGLAVQLPGDTVPRALYARLGLLPCDLPAASSLTASVGVNAMCLRCSFKPSVNVAPGVAVDSVRQCTPRPGCRCVMMHPGSL
jgi:hypothetical protein